MVTSRGGGAIWGMAKWVKGIDCMVMDGNEIFSGEHAVVYREVEI